MTTISFTISVNSSFGTPANWSSGSVPGPGDDALIGVPGVYTVFLNAPITVQSIDITDTGATLSVGDPGGTESVTAGLTNTGTLDLDVAGGGGGTTLAIGGTLTNSGVLQIGPENFSLSAPDLLSAAALDNTSTGAISLWGSGNGDLTPEQATLDLTTEAAPATLVSSISLNGDALLEYLSGPVTAVGSGASLTLNGTNSRLADASDTATNSALVALASNAGTLTVEAGALISLSSPTDFSNTGSFYLRDGASVTGWNNFTNSGTWRIDDPGGDGSTTLTLSGTLTNSGVLQIGPENFSLSAPDLLSAAALDNTSTGAISLWGSGNGDLTPEQATLDLTTEAAPATLVGSISLNGDALLEYLSGPVTAVGSGASLTLNGTNSRLADASDTATNSALVALASNAGTLTVEAGALISLSSPTDFSNTGSFYLRDGASVTGWNNFTNSGTWRIDDPGGDGGTTLTLSGTLTNSGVLQIGPENFSLSAPDLLSAAALDNTSTGAISLWGSGNGDLTPEQATLDLTTEAAPATLVSSISLNGDALLEYLSGPVTAVGSGASLTLNGTNSRLADASDTATNSALVALASNAGTLTVEAGALISLSSPTDFSNTGSFYLRDGASVTGWNNFTNSGTWRIDDPGGDGSTTLTLSGTLTNSGVLQIGPENFSLSAPDLLSAAALDNTSTGAISLWGSGNGDLTPEQATLDLTTEAAPATLVGSISLNGDALLEYLSGPVTAVGSGASLTLNGTNSRLADASDTATNSALVALASNAGTLTVEAGALISLSSPTDFSNTGSFYLRDGASVTGWNNFTNSGTWRIDDPGGDGGTTLTLSGTLTNSGVLQIGPENFSLSAPDLLSAAALDNTSTGAISLWGSGNGDLTPEQATLDLTTEAAPATLVSSISLNGDALLEYLSGPVTAVGSGASLTLNGTNSRLADASDTATNSALVALASNAGTLTVEAGALISLSSPTDFSNTGSFYLRDGASVTGWNNFTNSGTWRIDDPGGDGSTTLTLSGTLTNSGVLQIGPENFSLSAPDLLSAAALDNTSTGAISLWGSGNGDLTPEQATLDLTTEAAPATLVGSISLNGDALLEYLSGPVTAVGSGASLTLNGTNSRLADASDTATNSALVALASNAGTLTVEAGALISLSSPTDFSNTGSFYLRDGASVTGWNNFTNSGTWRIDDPGGDGSTTLTLSGTLTNSGVLQIGPENFSLSAPDLLSAAALDNTSTGAISLWGSGNGDLTPEQATLDLTTEAAPATLVGSISLNGDALLEYLSGPVTAVGSGASLTLNGTNSRLADASDTATNSALVALASNAGTLTVEAGALISLSSPTDFSNTGSFYLRDGASVTGWNNFTNSGTWRIDDPGGDGSTTLTLSGTLTNSGVLQIGPENFSLSAPDLLSAAALDNTSTGAISLWGSSDAITAALTVSGAAINSGNITLNSFSDADIAGPLTSTSNGTITVGANAELELGSAANGTIDFNGTGGVLKLDQPSSFAGTITNFSLGDTIDLGDTAALGASQSGGTLTVDLSDGETLTYSLPGYFVGEEFEVTPNGSDSDIALVVGADIPPTIIVPGPVTAGVGQSLAISGVEVTDPVAVSVGETITATLTDTLGLLSANTDAVGGGGTITGSGSDALTIVGSLAQVDADLTTLAYVAATAGTDTIDVNANDGRGGVAPERTIAVNVVTPAPAQLEVTPTNINFGIVHIGDTIQQSLAITNDAALPALGLDAEFSGTTAGVIATGSITDLPAERTDASDLSVGIDTSESGTIDGSATLSASSYGGGPLPSQTIEVEGTVEAYAVPALTLQSVGFTNPLPGAQLSQIGNQWTLDLGSDPAGTAISPIDLIAENEAVGLADTLGGSWSFAPTTAFNILGAASFSGVSDMPPVGPIDGSVGSPPPHGLFIEPLDTSPGVNTETIVLQPTSDNTSSSTALQDQTITVVDTITASTYNDPIITAGGTDFPPALVTQFEPALGLPLLGGVLTQIGNSFTLGFPDLTSVGSISPFYLGVYNRNIGTDVDEVNFTLAYDGGDVKILAPGSDSEILPGSYTGMDSLIPTGPLIQVQEGGPTVFAITSNLGPQADENLTILVGNNNGCTGPGGSGGNTGFGTNPDSGIAAVAIAWGDPHLITFDGVDYNLQQVGEFVLAESTEAGDNFQIQIRTKPYLDSQSVAVIQQVAMAIGTDRITIDATRADPVWVDGAPITLTAADPTMAFAAGLLSRIASNTYLITYDTGESVRVTLESSYLNVDISAGAGRPLGTMEGLLGPDDGNASSDFMLPDGTVLEQPLSQEQLYDTFANAWRVTQDTSLLDYGPGQTTATFTDLDFPEAPVSLSSLPANVVAQATSLVAAAGITDPGLAQGAILDYALTGDMSFITTAKDEQAQDIAPTVTLQPGPVSGPTALGISAEATLVASPGPTTPVAFTIYATGTVTADTMVSYAVIAPEAGDFDAADFGGILPSGTATIAAGASTATFTLNVPSSLDGQPSETLEVQISDGADEPPVDAPTATTQVIAPAPVAGAPGQPAFEEESGPGQLTQVGSSWNLHLGSVVLGASVAPVTIAIANIASVSADSFFGNVDASGDGSFLTSVAPVATTDPGQVGETFVVTLDTGVAGSHTETIVLSPTDTNVSGYSSSLPAETLTITADVMPCFAAGTRLATAHDETAVEDLREGDLVVVCTGAARALRPVRWIGRRRLNVLTHPQPAHVQPIRLRRGGVADGVPHRDLLVSPDHAVCIDGKLIPARLLVNGATIVRDESVRWIEYFHVELEQHSILLAEGLTAESYLDTGNRGVFDNADAPLILHPDFEADAQQRRELGSCAPLVTDAASLEPIWRALAGRAAALGYAGPELMTTDDPALRIVADDRTILPIGIEHGRRVFVLPPGVRRARLVSRAAAPCDTQPWIEDRRRLGVMVKRLVLRNGTDTSTIAMDDPRLTDGWWAAERDSVAIWRWTNGDADLPIAGDGLLVVEVVVGDTVPYPVAKREPAEALVAA